MSLQPQKEEPVLNHHRGLVFVIEGGEYSGKGDLIERLKVRLADLPFIFSREPGGTPISEKVRAFLQSDESGGLGRRTELMFFEAARMDHVERVIEPARASGKHVLLDRFDMSTGAYNVDLDSEDSIGFFYAVNGAVTRNVRPDAYLFLDLPVDVALARREGRAEEQSRNDKKPREWYEKIRTNYLRCIEELMNSEKCFIVDANRTRDELADEVERIIRRLLAKQLAA